MLVFDSFQEGREIWTDIVEGGDGLDRLDFFGANINENFDISAKGGDLADHRRPEDPHQHEIPAFTGIFHRGVCPQGELCLNPS